MEMSPCKINLNTQKYHFSVTKTENRKAKQVLTGEWISGGVRGRSVLMYVNGKK
jgi:hypothetical protein